MQNGENQSLERTPVLLIGRLLRNLSRFSNTKPVMLCSFQLDQRFHHPNGEFSAQQGRFCKHSNWVFLLFHHLSPAEFGLEICGGKSAAAGSSSNRAVVPTDNRVSLLHRDFTLFPDKFLIHNNPTSKITTAKTSKY